MRFINLFLYISNLKEVVHASINTVLQKHPITPFSSFFLHPQSDRWFLPPQTLVVNRGKLCTKSLVWVAIHSPRLGPQKQAQRKKMQERGQKLVTKRIVRNQHVSYTYKVVQMDRGSFVAHGFLLFYSGFCEPFRQHVKVD